MKKLSNIQTLKNLVNADVLECIKCRIYGVQAYNISANEYEVIVKFAKQGGRYYFIDRDGNRYLASRYDRAEQVAADILENIECTELTVNALVDEMQTTGKVAVISEVLDLFLDECDRREIEAESVENHYHEDGETYAVYRLKDEQNAQSNETAADEQQTENEETATTCEPSAFSRILAKMKNGAKIAAEKMEFVFVLLVAFAVGFLAMYGAAAVVASIVEAFGLCGSIWGCVLSLLLFLSVGFDFMGFAVLNVMATFARVFPSVFERGRKPHFVWPASFWYSIYTNSFINIESYESKSI